MPAKPHYCRRWAIKVIFGATRVTHCRAFGIMQYTQFPSSPCCHRPGLRGIFSCHANRLKQTLPPARCCWPLDAPLRQALPPPAWRSAVLPSPPPGLKRPRRFCDFLPVTLPASDNSKARNFVYCCGIGNKLLRQGPTFNERLPVDRDPSSFPLPVPTRRTAVPISRRCRHTPGSIVQVQGC